MNHILNHEVSFTVAPIDIEVKFEIWGQRLFILSRSDMKNWVQQGVPPFALVGFWLSSTGYEPRWVVHESLGADNDFFPE